MRTIQKAIGAGIAITATLVFNASNARAQNRLVDADFENASGISATYGPPAVNQGWGVNATPVNPAPGQSDMNQSSEYPESGNYALLMQANPQSPPAANFSRSTAQQIVSGITPGTTYMFSIWYLTDDAPDASSTLPPVVLEFDFLNSSQSYISSLETTVGYSNGQAPGTVITGYGAVNTGFGFTIPNEHKWYQGGITGTAPAGAAYAVVYAEFLDYGQVMPEQLYFDNASLAIVPEPSTAKLVWIGLGAIPLCWCRRKQSSTWGRSSQTK